MDREKFFLLLERLVRLEGRAAQTFKVSDSEHATKARIALARHCLGQISEEEAKIISEME